jgi:hypothetical protein
MGEQVNWFEENRFLCKTRTKGNVEWYTRRRESRHYAGKRTPHFHLHGHTLDDYDPLQDVCQCSVIAWNY